MSADELTARAAELREAFDGGFAEPPAPPAADTEDYLALRLGGDAYAINLLQTAGLHEGKRWRALPGAAPGLLGIAGFRGALLPVYDLNVLLGYPATATPRWIVQVAARPVAIAFERMEGHVRVARDALSPSSAVEGGNPVHATLHTDAGVRGVLHLPTLVETIVARAARKSL